MEQTVKLQQSILHDLASLLDNEKAMARIQKYIHRVKKEEEEQEEVMTAEEEQEVLDSIRDGLREVKLAREGKIKLQSAREFLDEIRR